MLSASSSASRSLKSSLGSSMPSSKERLRRRARKRQSRETAVTSLSSGSSTMYSGGDNQSVISAITMDFFDEDTTVSSANDRSYNRQYDGPKLGSMPEQKRSSDPGAAEVESCLDQMKFHHSTSNSTNRFSCSGPEDTKLCAMPRRRSSNSESLEFRIDQAALKMNDCFLSEESFDGLDDPAADDDDDDATEVTDGCSMRSLHDSVDETDPFQVGLYGDDDGESDDYHQPPLPKQKAHHFDSCVSMLGSSGLFDDSFQAGCLEDEEDLKMFSPGKRTESALTQKTSNMSNYSQFRSMYGKRASSSNSMAAIMKSGTGSDMFDSFQLGLLEEEEVELPDYSERLNDCDETTEKNNDTFGGKTAGGKHKTSSGVAASRGPAIESQSLQLDDVFGSGML